MKQTRWATEQQELASKVQGLSEYIQTEEDPMEVLQAIRDLRELLPALEKCAALEAKSNDWTWQQIADAIGISKQAAFERYTGMGDDLRFSRYLKKMGERRAAQVR